MKSMLSDKELVLAFRNGDNSAMDILINRYHRKVSGISNIWSETTKLPKTYVRRRSLKQSTRSKATDITKQAISRHGL